MMRDSSMIEQDIKANMGEAQSSEALEARLIGIWHNTP